MRAFRLMVLFMAFTLDVHVKADEVAASDCMKAKERCAISATEKRTVEGEGLRLTMGAGALLEKREESMLQLVEGRFYVEATKPIVFNSPYVKVWCERECKGLFLREADAFVVKALEGRWTARRTGEKQTYAIPAGFQTQFGEVTSEGSAQMEFPQSLPWTPTVNEWAALYPGKVDQFKPTLVKFRAVWREAVEAVSLLQQQSATRAIASEAKAEADARARRMAIEREDKGLRAMFREKNP